MSLSVLIVSLIHVCDADLVLGQSHSELAEIRTWVDKIVIRSKIYLHNSPSNTIDQLNGDRGGKHMAKEGDEFVDAHLNVAVVLHRDNVDSTQG
jgi:hypothetical protein